MAVFRVIVVCLLFAARVVGAARFVADEAQLTPRWPHVVEPRAECHDRLNRTHCLTVFCYFNPNDDNVTVAVAPRWNAFSPAPHDRGQPRVFRSFVHDDCFPVVYRCGGFQGLRPNRRRLEWLVRTDHPTDRRVHRASSTRDTKQCAKSWFRAANITNAHGRH